MKIIKRIYQKSMLKEKIDNYLENRILETLKGKLDFNNTREFKKIFEVGVLNLQWELSINKGEKVVVKELENALKINCYTDSHLSRDIFSNNFENSELIFLKNYLKKGDVFVDIGANIGLFSMFACQKVGSDGYVIAYEPTPKTYNRLLENFKLNAFTNLETYQLAISDNNKPQEFKISKDGYDGWNSLGKPTLGQFYESVYVDCNTIDNIAGMNKIFSRIKLIKIDVEGWELHVLKGGKDFFSKPDAPTLLIEFAEQSALNAGNSCEELYDYLNYLGYTLYQFDSINLNLTISKKKTFFYENLVATKNVEGVKFELSNI